MKKERMGSLNLLMLRQSYLVRKLQSGEFEKLHELKEDQANSEIWHAQECDKIRIQARTDEINQAEKVRIYHHDLHSKHL